MNLPVGLSWRPATPDDADAIVVLQDACFEIDGGYREVAEEIRERFDSPMLDVESDTLLGLDDTGAVMVSIWNYVVPEPVDSWKVYDDTYVHPDIRTPEIRDAVLDWWMQRALERVSDDVALPIEYHQHVYPATQQGEIAYLESRGFTPSIWFDELRRDLAQPIPKPAIPKGMTLVPFFDTPSDAALRARNDAFRDHRGSQPWTRELWDDRINVTSRAPEASFAVLEGETVVAYVWSGLYPQDWDDRGYSEGWIESVGTIRSHRGRGLARSVINAAMASFKAAGIEYATLEVDAENPTGATGLYASLGFERVRGYIDYTLIVDPDTGSPHG
ncbi:MAG: GNAT family N-acetyltransferase [Acidimicrobiia bacterium]|nr:GNAT family N-acetyltransferase [Acidimicrobiia bacterium]